MVTVRLANVFIVLWLHMSCKSSAQEMKALFSRQKIKIKIKLPSAAVNCDWHFKGCVRESQPLKRQTKFVADDILNFFFFFFQRKQVMT